MPRRGQGRPNETYKLCADARLIAVSVVELGDQQPEISVHLIQPGIGRVNNVLGMIDQPRSKVLERAAIVEVRPD